MRYLFLFASFALTNSVAFAQRDANVPDPDPELERKTFTVAPGFEVTLWAADPLLAKPIQMNFDPQGRLWVASSEIYPQIKPGEKANDKIIILEDTKGLGKADKTTVFADGLLIPTGLEPGDGGVYVANSTELVHLSASKPGGKADKRKVVLSGFGTEDTHHIIHTFRWGPDCRLYFNQSIYIHSHIETPFGVKRLNAGGIWRFNPDKTELDVFARGWVNAWGHAFDKYGQSLVTDGAGGEGINHAIPGGYFPQGIGPHGQRILHGLNPGSPKYCGLEVISGRHFPDDWQGDVITNDFRGHRVCRFKLQEDGSTYASREQSEVIKSNHPAFRPIDVKMGPDGALYIADWYNPIIQHGEVDFRDPRRDHTHGRIWRVTAKGRDLVKPPKLVDATIPELLDQLKAPEQWTRQQAKRVLKEHGAEKVLPELKKWEGKLAAGDEHARLEAAWVWSGFGYYPKQGQPVSFGEIGDSRDARVVAAAIRIAADVLITPQSKNADEALNSFLSKGMTPNTLSLATFFTITRESDWNTFAAATPQIAWSSRRCTSRARQADGPDARIRPLVDDPRTRTVLAAGVPGGQAHLRRRREEARLRAQRDRQQGHREAGPRAHRRREGAEGERPRAVPPTRADRRSGGVGEGAPARERRSNCAGGSESRTGACGGRNRSVAESRRAEKRCGCPRPHPRCRTSRAIGVPARRNVESRTAPCGGGRVRRGDQGHPAGGPGRGVRGTGAAWR